VNFNVVQLLSLPWKWLNHLVNA